MEPSGRRDALDLVIVGGGIMGLQAAFHASRLTSRVVVLEKATIGVENTSAASFSLTRSIRNDYLEPLYARLAHHARRSWLELERKAAEPFLIECGCLNLVKHSITPDPAQAYATRSYRTLRDLHLRAEELSRDIVRQRFPQFAVDLANLDVEAGFLYVPEVTRTLLAALRQAGVAIREGTEVTGIKRERDLIRVGTTGGDTWAASVVVTAGLGTNDLLARVESCSVRFPLRHDRPLQCKYFIPPPGKRATFTADVLPVFAYLDVGIYGHPIHAGRTPGVKIGFYHPPDVPADASRIRDVHNFVDECMPALSDAQAVDVIDADQCAYDLVSDDDFILGPLPGAAGMWVGAGWRGTGYKYAPWVGETLAQLALQGGTVYDIDRFDPFRFEGPNASETP